MYFLARNVLPGKNTHLPSQWHLRAHRFMFYIALGQTCTSRRINKSAANKSPNVPLRAVQRSNPQLDRAKCVSRFSKSATIITFDSRKRSKRVEGNPHAADIRKSSSPEAVKIDAFISSALRKLGTRFHQLGPPPAHNNVTRR